MIPLHLVSNPFPDSNWAPDMRPVVVIDGQSFSIKSLKSPLEGKVAYVVGVNQSSFEKLIDYVRVESFHFYEMRVPNISSILKCSGLTELAIHWNTKVEDISPVSKVSNLKALILEDTPKVRDLSPVGSCTKLEIFEFSGGIDSKNKAQSLDPISLLKSLRHLSLLNLKIENGGLTPLAKLQDLLELHVSNQFPTEEYALLSVYLQNTKCSHFKSFIEIANPIDGKNVMVIGSRKPFLNLERDKEKIEKYTNEFQVLRKKIAANKRMQPDRRKPASRSSVDR